MSKQELRDFLDQFKFDQEITDKIAADCIQNDDGYYVYWPTNSRGGYLGEYELLAIVTYLNIKNREWDEEIDKYFAN